jgi:DNA mismatch repair protein MSH3
MLLNFKLKHPGLQHLVECGYNFRFFGEGADLASRSDVLFFGHNFNPFIIQSVCFTHHVGPHVQAGHKVDRVRWMETATLKHAGDKASGHFACQLC